LLPIILLGLGILYLALAFRIVVFIAAYTLLPLVMGLRLFDIGSFRSLRSLTDITGESMIGLLPVGVLKAGIFGVAGQAKACPNGAASADTGCDSILDSNQISTDTESTVQVLTVNFGQVLLQILAFIGDVTLSNSAMLELSTHSGDPDAVYRASEHVDEELNTFDAFHAALSGGLISDDSAYDALGGVGHVRLELDGNEKTGE
jgi:hypothetical protein